MLFRCISCVTLILFLLPRRNPSACGHIRFRYSAVGFSILGNKTAFLTPFDKPRRNDVGKFLDSNKGILDIQAWDYNSLLGTTFGMNKKQRIQTRDSGSSHAMTLMAVDLDDKGNPSKWTVENSWGASSGHNGYLIMTNEWFNEYMFRVVVNKKYIPKKILKLTEQKPIQLPAWDPTFMGEE